MSTHCNISKIILITTIFLSLIISSSSGIPVRADPFNIKLAQTPQFQSTIQPTDWPMFRHTPDNTASTNDPVLKAKAFEHYNALANTKKPRSPLGVDWSFPHSNSTFPSPFSGGLSSSPVVLYGIVYVCSSDTVYAFQNGHELWHYSFNNAVISSTPAVDWLAVDPADKQLKTLVFVAVVLRDHGNEDRLYALDATVSVKEEDRVKWQAPLRFMKGKRADCLSSPTIATINDEPLIFIGSPDGIYAFKLLGLSLLWHYQTTKQVDSSPAVAHTNRGWTVFVGSNDQNVYALKADASTPTGQVLWSYPTRGIVSSSPAVAHTKQGWTVFVGSDDQNVYALKADASTSTGQVLWRYQTKGIVSSSPAVAHTKQEWTVFVGSDDQNVYALKADASTSTGQLLWSYPTGSTVSSSPVVSNDVVFVTTTQDNKLYALNVNSGNDLGSSDSMTSTGGANRNPTVSGGRVFVATHFTLYAFRLVQTQQHPLC